MQRDAWMDQDLSLLGLTEKPKTKKQLEKEASEIRYQSKLIQPISSQKQIVFGDKGSSWRMLKLQKVFDIAKEEKRPVEQVALDRYGSLEEFQKALDEKAFLTGKPQLASVQSKEKKMDPVKAQDLNYLRAQAIKAKLKKAPNSTLLDRDYRQKAALQLNQELQKMKDEIHSDSIARQMKRAQDLEDLADQYEPSTHKKRVVNSRACDVCDDHSRIIAMGEHILLTLSDRISMLPGMCLLVPREHVGSTLELEDDAWQEIRNFQKCLIQMFSQQQKCVLFIEQVVDLKKHTSILCVPVPESIYEDAPRYFKESILAHSAEWSNNVKVIDTKRGFRRSMVKNLPYFHVWFTLEGGLGHVIEEDDWPEWFARQTIASPLDIEPQLWRRPRLQTLEELELAIKEFSTLYQPFDWTQ